MKKVLSVCVLIALLCVSCNGFAEAVFAQEEQVGTAGATIGSIAGIGGQAYLLYSDGRLARMDVKTREETTLGETVYTGQATTKSEYEERLTDGKIAVELMASDGQTLYGLNLVTGEIFRLLNDVGDFSPLPVVTASLSDVISFDNGKPMFDSICVLDAKLYLCVLSPSTMEYVLLGCDLATGAVTRSALKNVSGITAYRDGKLLCKQFDFSTLGDPNVKTSYYAYTPASDSLEALGDFVTEGELGGYGISGLAYDASADTLFYTSGSRVMAIDLASKTSRVSAYTGEGIISGMIQVSAYVPGYYILAESTGTCKLLALDSDAVKQGALVIYGEMGGEAHKSFAKNYPDIPVDVSTKFSSDLETLTQSMVSGAGSFDVLRLEMSYMPVDRLIQKGYCMDLTEMTDIQSRIAEMYPQFVDAVTFNGRLMAVPVGLTSYTYTVNEKLWTQELGLSLEELPKTLIELYDFIQNWEYDYADEHGDINVLQGANYQSMLFSMMMEDYLRYYQTLDHPLKFDTDLFKKLCKKLNEIDFAGITPSSSSSADFWTNNYLFGIYGITSMTEYSWKNDNKPLLLSLDDGMEPMISGSLALLIINPKTTKLDSALKYVDNYLDNLPKSSDFINLFPNHNDPVEAKQYALKKAELEAKLSELEQALASAAPSDQAALKEQMENQRAQLEAVEKDRYSIRQEDIAYYRETILPHIVLTKLNVLYSTNQDSSKEISTLLNQYLEGAVELDQMVRDLDKRVKMMQLEEQ